MNNSRKPLIAKIKIAQKELGMEDDVYRAVLRRMVGKDSCAKMGILELEKVLAEMQRLGFVPQRKLAAKPNHRASINAMLGKVEALLLDNGWEWNYAHAMAKRMFGVDRVQWLTDGHLHKLIAALQIAANRNKKEA